MTGGSVRRLKPLLTCAALTALLSACASGGDSHRVASPAEIDAHVAEASKRFDMPELWIREVIRQESGGRTTANGQPIVSKAGAMGLMQVMPATYDEMRRKHNLGSDPFDPHDNIIAGTAYLREMYNLFGAPGFLGAYNCGPGCYGDYLAGKRSLPGETKRYIASVGPRLNRVPAPNGADIVLVSAPSTDSPPDYGSAYAAPRPAPAYTPHPAAAVRSRPPVSVAALPPPAPTLVSAPAAVRVVAPDTSTSGSPAPRPALVSGASSGAKLGGGVWTVQLGAFRSPDDSQRVIDRARNSMPTLARSQRLVQAVDTQTGPLYRARLSGLSQQEAATACNGLVAAGMACFVVAPGA
ncbi:transglycosylase SLT domain-containing protein [Azospirillum picis]|uniref:Cell division septation protein DedD n=1 Tax=Azospirillum picis TaxID=488438 RepID=A0ABU0MVH7_9PROT|nr:transglycosylase SLT domain-containing protein [Azospirillum picis]MBP2299150.1 cell division septation protein DedD [Azospirillum picis]MDQ0537076.1 cell division septation protein DedD [Azospirillum picis]